jgi:hypothetical protein
MRVVSSILCVLFFMAVVFFQRVPVAVCFADEYEMSTDPRLAEPRKSFEQAQEYAEKGKQEFRRRPGLAQKMFEHAEDYFLKAEFLYRELGQKYGIDVSHEMAMCQKLYRDTHVMTGRARKESRGSASML